MPAHEVQHMLLLYLVNQVTTSILGFSLNNFLAV